MIWAIGAALICLAVAWSMGLLGSGRNLNSEIRSLKLDNREDLAGPLIVELARSNLLDAARFATSIMDHDDSAEQMELLARRALLQWPRQAILRSDLAMAIHARGRSEDALALLDEAPQTGPEIGLARSQILQEQGQYDASQQAAEQALAQSKSGSDPLNQGSRFDLEQSLLRQATAVDTLDPLEALRTQARTGQLAPNNAHNHLLVGLAQRQATQVLNPERRALLTPTEAYAAALAQTKRDPENPLGFSRMGMAELRSGDARRAVQSHKKALHLDASRYAVQIGLGSAMRSDEQRDHLHIQRFPDHSNVPSTLFPEWSVLSDLEKKTLCVSVTRNGVDTLVSEGIQFRIAHLEDHPDDWTSAEGILCCFVNEVTDLHPQHGWCVARAFAWWLFPLLDESKQFAVLNLIELSETQPHLFEFGHDGLADPQGFFSSCYVLWKVEQHLPRNGPALPAEISATMSLIFPN